MSAIPVWMETFGANSLRLHIRVHAGAKGSGLSVPAKSDRLRVSVSAPAVDGKANEAVIKLLSKELGVSKSSVALVQGMQSKDKTIVVQSLTAKDVERVSGYLKNLGEDD